MQKVHIKKQLHEYLNFKFIVSSMLPRNIPSLGLIGEKYHVYIYGAIENPVNCGFHQIQYQKTRLKTFFWKTHQVRHSGEFTLKKFI